MNWIRFCSAVVATLGLTTGARANHMFEELHNCGSCKSCGCVSSCEPSCCKPAIQRPCHVNVHTYQRACCDTKPACCQTAGPTACCKPSCEKSCCQACDTCKPSCAKKCMLSDLFSGHKCKMCNQGCCEKACCEKTCCEQKVCQTSCQTCNTCKSGCKGKGFLSRLFCHKKKCANPCEIAELIYTAQTACHPDDRESAVDEMGDYDCMCHPEVMCALIHALNDCDPEVRAEAADEIGDMLEDNSCCCSPQVVAALTHALADCDRDVRGEAEDALEVCGYCIVDGCCNSCKSCQACGQGGCTTMPNDAAPEQAPAAEDDMDTHETAPAPPEPKAYFPSRPSHPRTSGRSNRLSNLFGLN